MSNEFKWDEERVLEFVKKYGLPPSFTTWKKMIESFKASKQPKVEWEIVVGKNDKGYIFKWAKGQPHFMDDKVSSTCFIHSVKRLSDGEVFTVGDIVECSALNMPLPIAKFEIVSSSMRVCFCNGLQADLSYVRKVKIKLPEVPKELGDYQPVYLLPHQLEKLLSLLK
jgi:hypothetical protein